MGRTRPFRPLGLALVLLAAACGPPSKIPDASTAPSGTLKVTWLIQDRAGNALACDTLGVTAVSVAIGGEPRTVACGDGQTTFVDVLPGRYAVVVRLLVSGAVLAEEATNATVSPGALAEADISFALDPKAARAGSAQLRWLVDGMGGQAGCATLGATRFRAKTRVGSIASFEQIAPCMAGQLQLDDIQAGSYEVLVDLEDDRANPLSTSLATFQVVAGQTTVVPTINFIEPDTKVARILGVWTINRAAPAAACAPIDHPMMRLATLVDPGQVRLQNTVACSAGRAALDGIRDEIPRTVRFDLIDGFGAIRTSSTVKNVRIMRGKTTTVSVDLPAVN